MDGHDAIIVVDLKQVAVERMIVRVCKQCARSTFADSKVCEDAQIDIHQHVAIDNEERLGQPPAHLVETPCRTERLGLADVLYRCAETTSVAQLLLNHVTAIAS